MFLSSSLNAQPSLTPPAPVCPPCLLVSQLAYELEQAFKKKYGDESVQLLAETDTSANAKRSMKERFGLRKVKADGWGLVKAPLVPPVHLLQLDEEFRIGWIDYSALDAKVCGSVPGRCQLHSCS